MLPSIDTLKSYSKTGISSALTVMTVFGVLANIPPDQVHAFIAALQEVNNSVISLYGALTKLVAVGGPILIIVLGKVGLDKIPFAKILEKVTAVAQSSSPDAAAAQKTMLDATTTILNTTNAPASDSQEVKAAILNAAISMPEVSTTKIEVTDKALAEATPNDNVVASKNAT